MLRLALYRRFRDRNEAWIQAQARENSNFIESARAIQSIKLFNREADREGQWLNRHAETVNASDPAWSREDPVPHDERRHLRPGEHRDRLSGSLVWRCRTR